MKNQLMNEKLFLTTVTQRLAKTKTFHIFTSFSVLSRKFFSLSNTSPGSELATACFSLFQSPHLLLYTQADLTYAQAEEVS